MLVTQLSDARDPARFGAKAATLAALADRHRIPDGFAVAADASDDDVRALVPAAYAALGDVPVAVRSSAIGEDSRDASFAGQHDTILDVRGADAVVDAVLAVRRSATSERAAAYRREKGIDDVPRVAVLVQRMVTATASVIAFTKDPVTGDGGLVVVNACRGLGDAMASGEVTPDMFQVRKSDLEIVFANATLDGAALAHPQVQAVARLALELEREAGHAVDVEAAFQYDTLYLLQSRPVTAAGSSDDDFPITWPEPGDERITWQREDAHYADPVVPLSIDYGRFGPSTGIQRRNANVGLPMQFRFEEFNGRVYAGSRPLAPPEEVKQRTTIVLGGRLERARRLASDWPERHLPTVRGHYEWMRGLRPATLSAEEAARTWEGLWGRVSDIWEIHMTATGGAYGVMALLGQTYAKLTGRQDTEAFALTLGRALTLQRLQRDMFTLSETVRSLPRIAEAILGGVDAMDVLRDLPGGERATAALAVFLEQHGDVGQPNEQIESPAWRDDPRLLVHEIRRALEAPPADPDVRLARLLAESEATAMRVREAVNDRPEELARFEDLLAIARAAGPLTEEHNYWIDRITQAHVRRAALAFGERLVADGTVQRAGDIFHLYVPEVADALRRPRDLRAFVREREARHARNLRRRAPEFIGAPPAGPPGTIPGMIPRSELGYKEKQDDPEVLKGVPACAGIARGPARLVRYPADLDRVRAGDVLVCRASNVSYVPVYGKVAAVVTEVGGSLSHAAVVAREFGLPAVVGTSVALTVLRDGEVVEVDGGAGVVRKVAARVDSATRV